jgi:hypothetical protein
MLLKLTALTLPASVPVIVQVLVDAEPMRVSLPAPHEVASIKDAPRGRGRPGREIDGHANGVGGIVKGVAAGAAVGSTAHAAAGEDEPVALSPADEVLDSDEGLAIHGTRRKCRALSAGGRH